MANAGEYCISATVCCAFHVCRTELRSPAAYVLKGMQSIENQELPFEGKLRFS